jgi:uncharacterized protein (UPF0262 family)
MSKDIGNGLVEANVGSRMVAGKPTQSGNSYTRTQNYDSKWAGTGWYPEETLPFFDFYFKGKTAEHTGYMPNERLFEAITSNSPEIKVLDVERRNLDSETMGAIMSCVLGNTQITELKIARNVSFWSEQPDDFGNALAEVIKTTKTITKVDIKNNDIHEEAMERLMDAFKTNTTVTWLDMSDNFSRGKGEAIAEMIKATKTLTYLNLNVNQLTDEDSQLVLAAIDQNTTIKEFTAYNNGALDKNTRKRLRGFKK